MDKSTRQTLARVILVNNLRLPIDLKFGINANGGRNAKEVNRIPGDEMKNIHAILRLRTKTMTDKMNAKYDKSMNSAGFIEGDWVMLYNPQRTKGLA